MSREYLPMELEKLAKPTGNVYRTVSIIAKRSNQLTTELKEELSKRLAEFAPAHDNLEEIIENREQIEISRAYERRPKPNQEAVWEFLDGKIYWRNPHDAEDANLTSGAGI